MSSMTYVFDTSALIGAWIRSYPPDAFPRLWGELDGLAVSGRLLVPDEVYDELKVQDDELFQWVKDRKSQIVCPATRALLVEAKEVLASHPFLTKTGTGRGRADPFVIALAAIRGCPVVTSEQGGTAVKPRIPYVCIDRSVACLNFLELIRAEAWTF
jgi:hypothetical protein